jgi:DNA sulfur modification protein DndD
MLLRRLSLTNFGTYGGQQSIDLRTCGPTNIVLFGGKNGAGKSTLLEAIRLCFYGHLSDRSLFSREKYERYLDERVHRDPRSVIQPRFAAVGVEFEYGEQDATHIYEVTRSWERRNGSKVTELFQLAKDGHPVTDVSADHWQDFVRDLIPPGVSDLFFFDGERIQHLAEGTHDQETLSDAVKNLLGADLIERLQADLGIYRSNLTKLQSSTDESAALQALEEKVRATTQQLVPLEQETVQLDSTVIELQTRVSRAEAELATWGGNLSKDKDRLQQERARLRAQKDLLESQVREHAHALLPVALAPRLTAALLDQLRREDAASTNQHARKALHKSARHFLRAARALPADTRTKRPFGDTSLYKRIEALALRSFHIDEPDCPFVHSLSRDDAAQIESWIERAAKEIPIALRRLARELEDLYRKEQSIERALSRVPSGDLVRPLLDQLAASHKELANGVSAATAKHEEVSDLRRQLDALLADCRRLTDVLASRITKRDGMERASRIQDALGEYKQVLIEKKIHDLQAAASQYFNLLSHKHSGPRRVSIHPVTFEVSILDEQNRGIRKQELSAGEKQIYAVSMLWALAKVSGRPLPMIIDTPLARLDADHRTLLSRHYFPKASHQVLILSTDTEIDEQYFSVLRPAIARSYELAFLPEQNRTEVRSGYFRAPLQ